VLVPLTFGKAELALDPNHKYFCVLFVENDCSTDWFVQHEFLSDFASVDSNRSRSVSSEFTYELVSLVLPVWNLRYAKDMVDIVVESFLDLVG
jgi:hypothetical protein